MLQHVALAAKLQEGTGANFPVYLSPEAKIYRYLKYPAY